MSELTRRGLFGRGRRGSGGRRDAGRRGGASAGRGRRQAACGRRRGRRRARRPDRRARAAARRQVGGRARGATPRRRPRVEPRARRRRGVRARRHVRRPDAGPHDRPRQGARRRHVPDLQRGRQRRYIGRRPALEWSDTGPTGTAPPDPTILPELATTVAQLDEMSKEVPVDAPWEAAKAHEWDGQTLETWIRDNTRDAALSRARAARDAADLRRRAARAVAAVRALLHRRLGQRDARRARSSATSTRATARRCSALDGGSGAVVDEAGRATSASRLMLRHAGAPDRAARGRRARSRPTSSSCSAKRVIVAVPPALAGRIDYSPALAVRARPADAAHAARAR